MAMPFIFGNHGCPFRLSRVEPEFESRGERKLGEVIAVHVPRGRGCGLKG